MTFQNIVQTYFMLSEIIVVQSAPKIGYVLFDPLLYEDKEVKRNELRSSPDKTNKLDRDQNSNNENKKPCQGYDYNESKCKYVNNRLLCGYNKNIGENKNYDEIIDLGNGCRIRGDRMECGYIIGPFNFPRRPPADVTSNPEQSKRLRTNMVTKESSPQRLKLNASEITSVNPNTEVKLNATNVNRTKIKSTSSSPTTATTSITTSTRTTTKITTESTSSTISNSKLILSPSLSISTTEITSLIKTSRATHKRNEKKCVEKLDRIVCYDIKY